ncbi:MAG: DUF6259 domain-containing protein [Planctomycetota bacterium]|jgi:hypothetical protein
MRRHSLLPVLLTLLIGVAASVRAPAGESPGNARTAVTVEALRGRIQAARKEMAGLQGNDRQQAFWRIAGAEQLGRLGRLSEAVAVAGGQRLPGWTVLSAGDLGLILSRSDDGVHVLSLFDSAADQEFLLPSPLPLFTLSLREAETKQELRLAADAGWKEVQVVSAKPGEGVEIRWQRPRQERLGDLRVVVRATPDRRAAAIRWKLQVQNTSERWSVRRVVFPYIALAELGPQAEVFFPRAPGEVQGGLWRRQFRCGGTYPSGWTSMQFMAAYDRKRNTGLYLAVHDPASSTKDISVESRPSDASVVLSVDHPAENMDAAGNDFSISGEAVWRLLRGDWFDAATIYGDWVRTQARWFPKLGAQGRGDTPKWMRELPVWVMTGGAPKECVRRVEEFAKFVDVPVGFHWYNWHQIPFDNDYPHYFPAKEGFAEAVRELQASGVYVMPYINGRLWDTRDKGGEDFEFSRLALPAASKDEQGEPYVETYGSKEADGSRVRLAAMCPATELWQQRVRQIVLRLFDECGVKAVYIDQVAAARPRLCFDESHGHPTGGGHWWTEAYGRLLESIHKAMPEDRVLTTECNAEPYAKWFDGYLTWHWQYDGQVPAFPAVYGGAIQMFGRAYRGGETKDLALRMKAGQQLVFGEQIGWLSPDVVREKENAEFLRQVVRLRWRLRRYFYAGRMARPPKLQGEIPKVRADWQWSGEWWVSTDAVLSGAWRLADENRCAVLLVNVSDKPVATRLNVDASDCGFSGPKVRLTKVDSEGPGESLTVPRVFQRELTLPPRTAAAWELTPP